MPKYTSKFLHKFMKNRTESVYLIQTDSVRFEPGRKSHEPGTEPVLKFRNSQNREPDRPIEKPKKKKKPGPARFIGFFVQP